MIHVHIDIREDDLWKEFESHTDAAAAAATWDAKHIRLDVGDVAFFKDDDPNPLVVLERKTAADLGASQKDGRYREQRARLYALRGTGASIGYVIEAPAWSPTLSRTWCNGRFNEVQLQQSIIRLQFKHTIPVFHSAGVKDTASWIRRIASMLAADPAVFVSSMATTTKEAATAYTESIHVKKSANTTHDRLFVAMLQTMPGVGTTAADAIARHVSYSLSQLLALDAKDLASIVCGKRKFGKVAAGKMSAFLHGGAVAAPTSDDTAGVDCSGCAAEGLKTASKTE
jgi:ERCC4-type nuclease